MIHDILATTKDLIRFQTVLGNTQAFRDIFAYCSNKLSDFPQTSFSSQDNPSLLVSNAAKQTKQFKIILNAHVDVVHADDEAFRPYEQDGKLFGRGAYDMKSGAAVMMHLFKELAPKLSYPLGLQIVSDEEMTGEHGTGHQLQQGIRSEFAITGEGSQFRVIHQAKGRLVIKFTARGKSAHAAYPWRGNNAIWELQQLIHILLQKYPLPTTDSEDVVINIARFETTNNTYNKIPEDCNAYLDIRYMSYHREDLMVTINQLLSEKITLEILEDTGVHVTAKENKYITLLRKTGEKHGKQLPLGLAYARSDMVHFTAVGCDGIEFGPAGANHHGKGEYVDIQSVEDYYRILKDFLLAIDRQERIKKTKQL